MSYQNLFATLWDDYTARNPQALKIYDLFIQNGVTVINDHIALRTFNDPRINIEVLAKTFIDYGYEEKGEYNFPIKKLFAKHYEHPDKDAPKVFISELKLEDFSQTLQDEIKKILDPIPTAKLHENNLIYSGVLWKPLSYKIYQSLLVESEYAAWMYAFGFCANHFTVNINASNKFSEIPEVNDFLIQQKIKLNTSGGLVKGTPSDYLEQSSTLAEEIAVEFIEGVFNIPSCYYEFAKRYPLKDGKLYTGFVAASADKIFESTDVKR